MVETVDKFSVGGGKKGKADADGGAEVFGAIELNAAAVAFNAVFHDDEAEAGALDGGNIAAAMKGGEEVFTVSLRDAGTTILDDEDTEAALTGDGDLDGDIGGRVFDGVDDEVGENGPEQIFIGARRVGDIDVELDGATPMGGGVEFIDELAAEFGEI